MFWILLTVLAVGAPVLCQESLLYWGYECREAKCVKVNLNADNANTTVGLSTCRLYCGGKLGTVWPKPTGIVKIEQAALRIRTRIKYYIQSHANLERLWSENRRRFQSQINSKIPDPTLLRGDRDGKVLTIKISINQTDVEAAKLPSLRYDTDESYSLDISNSNNDVVAVIKAKSFFGARHGLETLSQLIVYDEVHHEILVLSEAEITDAPVYKHRGVMLDTSRNYFSTKAIKRTIDAMAMNKMNRFHWHMVDTASFPLVIKSHPDLHTIGAYSFHKIYTHEAIADLVEYARARGVSIVPDFDGPGRAGEGWQLKNMTLCFNDVPWKYDCPPPCGVFDPTNDELYSVLEDIYREIFQVFDLDVFNMGGSHVILKCWQDSEKIRKWMLQRGWGLEDSDYMRLWLYFQTNALTRVDNVSHTKQIPIITWAEPLIGNLDSSRYIMQMFPPRGSGFIRNALQKGHKVILSNLDALFLDCGFENTYGDGNNGCSPYKGWQKIYENRPKEIAGDKSHLILGAETANWAEQLGEHSVDARFWPRSSALAERLWSDPDENWRAAEARMLVHRERLMENGIAAAGLQPEWCLQNEDKCPRM